MRHVLTPHPRSRCDAVTSLEVEATRDGLDRLALRYVLAGALDRLVIPAAAAAEQVDGLWNHTCFEAFVGAGDEAYREFNFAPSTRWAAYRFDAYRQGMTPLDGIEAPRIETAASEGTLEMHVSLALPPAGPLRLGLAAVIEELGGRLSYWALRHPAEQPDFHHPAGLALEL